MSEYLPAGTPDSSYINEAMGIQAQRDYILGQYRIVAGVFELFWREVGVRTDKALWRLEGSYQGVGTCRDVDYDLASDLIGGLVQIELMHQRDWKNHKTDGVRKYCPFFRVNQGCILGNLKSPRCLDHVEYEHGKEIRAKFGFKVPDMRQPLLRIQMGGVDPESSDFTLKPEKNDEFVGQVVSDWLDRIDYIRTFPILHPEEAAQIDMAEILSTEPIHKPEFRRFQRKPTTSHLRSQDPT